MSSVNDFVLVDKVNVSTEPTKFKTQAAATARTTMGLGTMATQNSNAVSVTGGAISGITDLAVADGGTGASAAAQARINLGLGTIAVQNATGLALTGDSTTSGLWNTSAGDTRFLMSGNGATQAISFNFSNALDASATFTIQYRTPLNAFMATVGGYLGAAARWFFGGGTFGTYYMCIGGSTGINGNLELTTAGNKLAIKEGTNASMGLATLAAGTVTVNTTAVTANSRIHYCVQTAGGTQGFLRISARTAGTSFTIASTQVKETSTIAWWLVEPAP